MFNAKNRRPRGFTTVEILVAVGLIAILMVVAVPRLLDLRGGVSDSATKQQLQTVKVSLDNWLAERGAFGTELTVDVLQQRTPDVEIVANSAATGEGSSRALKVGFDRKTNTEVVIAAFNGADICWAIRVSTAGTEYAGKTAADGGSCTAGGDFSWKKFGFPQTEPGTRTFAS